MLIFPRSIYLWHRNDVPGENWAKGNISRLFGYERYFWIRHSYRSVCCLPETRFSTLGAATYADRPVAVVLDAECASRHCDPVVYRSSVAVRGQRYRRESGIHIMRTLPGFVPCTKGNVTVTCVFLERSLYIKREQRCRCAAGVAVADHGPISQLTDAAETRFPFLIAHFRCAEVLAPTLWYAPIDF